MRMKTIIIVASIALSSLLFFVSTLHAADRFVVGENTIKDTKTGLIWHKQALSQNAIVNGALPDAKGGDDVTFDTVLINKFLKTLKTDDHSDWRMPTEEEFKTFADFIMENKDDEETMMTFIMDNGTEDSMTIMVHYLHKYNVSVKNEENLWSMGMPRILIPVRGKM